VYAADKKTYAQMEKHHNSLSYNLTYGFDRVICMSSIVADDASVATIVVADCNDWGIVGSLAIAILR